MAEEEVSFCQCNVKDPLTDEDPYKPNFLDYYPDLGGEGALLKFHGIIVAVGF